jgi:hypothetical protein
MELLEQVERLDPVAVVHACRRVKWSIISTFKEFSKRGSYQSDLSVVELLKNSET